MICISMRVRGYWVGFQRLSIVARKPLAMHGHFATSTSCEIKAVLVAEPSLDRSPAGLFSLIQQDSKNPHL